MGTKPGTTHTAEAWSVAYQEISKRARFGGFYYLIGVLGITLCTPQITFSSPLFLTYTLFMLLILVWRERGYQLIQKNPTSTNFFIFSWSYMAVGLLWTLFSLQLLSTAGKLAGAPAVALVATAGFVASSVTVLIPHYRTVVVFVLIMQSIPALVFPFIISGNERWLTSGLYLLFGGFLIQYAHTQSKFYWQKADILTALKTRTQELEQARVEALAGSKAKADFLANMSHEIRTPMNGVIGMVELLKGTELNVSQARYLDIISSSGTALIGIIDDILDFSKLEANKLDIHPQPVDIKALVVEVTTLFQLQHQAGDVAIQARVDEQLPRWLLTDPQRLRQVLYNLISNAIKFTQRGEVQIHISGQCEGTQCHTRFEIIDTGLGIAAEDQQKLFGEFQQLSGKHNIKGTGLGLAICRRLVTLLGGKIGCISQPGKGSTFWFELPLAITTQSPGINSTALHQAVNDHQANLGLRVLLIEDNKVNQMVAEGYLRHLGCHCTTAATGTEGIEQAINHSFDIILMDCDLPDIDGFTVTRKIRAHESNNKVKSTHIIALTAHILEEAKDQCFAAGMNDYLSKPIMREQLSQKLRQAYASIVHIED